MSNSKDQTNISIIIPTRNRAESLRITLECLASADREGIGVEVIVVDNGGNDHTKDVVASFENRIAVRFLCESAQGVYGKSHSLNRALDMIPAGEIIVVLDDDMSLPPDWLLSVAEVCRRWPDKDIFGGDIYTIWPFEDVPEWAKSKGSQRLVLSAGELGDSEAPLPEGRWFGGNHFWFRSRVLEGRRRFKDIWMTEPDFQLDLMELGFGSLISPKTKAGHRVQAELLKKDVAMQRARKVGTTEAWLRLEPYRNTVKQARLFRSRPWTSVMYCTLKLMWWWGQRFKSYRYAASGRGFELRCMSAFRIAYYWGLLRAVFHLESYSFLGGRSEAQIDRPTNKADSVAAHHT